MGFDVIYNWLRVKVYSPLETLLHGIAAVVASWSGLGNWQFSIYQRMVSNPQGTWKKWYCPKHKPGRRHGNIGKYKDGAVGLTAGRLNPINVKTKVMQPLSLCVVVFCTSDRSRVCSSVAHSSPPENIHKWDLTWFTPDLSVQAYWPLETILLGIAAVVAHWSALGSRQFPIYQRMVSNPQGTWKNEILSKTGTGPKRSKYRNIGTARSGSWSMVALTAQRLNPIDVKAKVVQPFGLCLCRSFSHVGQITSLLICSP